MTNENFLTLFFKYPKVFFKYPKASLKSAEKNEKAW